MLSNKQANASARRIPFNANAPLPPDVHAGLTRIVRKQVARQGNKGARPWLHSNTGIGSNMPKAPGHDAAAKALKERKHDGYTVLDATDAASLANYEQDRRARR